jgi:uncharacterized protein with HEPN domain
MQPSKQDAAYLWDMLDAAKAVREFVQSRSYKDYQMDRMLRSAVERNIEIIGEAARHVSDAYQETHPEIPWKSIIGQRNILAHEYGEVKHERIWAVASGRIPELISQFEKLMPEVPPEMKS